jgi:hypothetical protein
MVTPASLPEAMSGPPHVCVGSRSAPPIHQIIPSKVDPDRHGNVFRAFFFRAFCVFRVSIFLRCFSLDLFLLVLLVSWFKFSSTTKQEKSNTYKRTNLNHAAHGIHGRKKAASCGEAAFVLSGCLVL